ncbi:MULTISPECIES: SpoIIE family protein phosphatase [unclassified Streptomyces]|uniref:SpoIIE family protein phosphatase n=1 Tax=unclassified Streptomyces TaxID=2593676 RepID=UPI000DC332CE|nr:SpoIIE family protein phosphatase [Streptomyces sp. PsTaAH-137]RAJ82729.1 GAF domain-containing protein [Streptomyces sp. PsTaAH-137]
MGAGREDGTAGADDAELRQLQALNRMPGPSGEAPADPAPRPRNRAAELLVTGHALAQVTSLGEALTLVAQLAGPQLPLGAQAVFRADREVLHCVGNVGLHDGDDTQRALRLPLDSVHPATQVARTGRPVFLASPEEFQERFPVGWQLSDRDGHRAWAFLPLTTYGQLTGVWMAAFEVPVPLTDERGTFLLTLARLLGQSIEQTYDGQADRALSQSLRSSMSRIGPGVEGLTLAARYVPTGGGLMVGGDWFDSITLPNGRLGLVIGDVQGHDVHAAGLMSQLRTAIHAYAAEGHGPDAVLVRASRFLASLGEGRFATCIYLEADPATGTLRIARAGHPHPVLRLPDGTSLLKHVRGGLPLGLDLGEDDYPVSVVTLRADEILMLCTDGLIESGGHDMYSGWLRVRDALAPGSPDDLDALADRLMNAVVNVPATASGERPAGSSFTEDDIALLLLRRDPSGARAVRSGRHLRFTLEQDQAQGLADARIEFQGLLHDWARPEQVDTVLLLVSELLGNVLVHTEYAAALRADISGARGARRLRVEVTDRSDDVPHRRAPGELSSSGRGLLLLDLLAQRWNIRPEPEGKTVWFEVDEDGPEEP